MEQFIDYGRIYVYIYIYYFIVTKRNGMKNRERTILESYIAFAINLPRNLNLVLSFARCDTLVLHGIGVANSPCIGLT